MVLQPSCSLVVECYNFSALHSNLVVLSLFIEFGRQYYSSLSLLNELASIELARFYLHRLLTKTCLIFRRPAEINDIEP